MKIFFILILIIILGCSGPASEKDAEWLIQVGDRIAKVNEFEIALEIAKSAYPQKVMNDEEIFAEIKTRLLEQMIEEMILLEMGKKMNVTVSEDDLNAEVAIIKNDYPDDIFDQILLEQAISYNVWKQRLKVNMIINKVIDKALKGKIVLTRDDIYDYYNKSFKGKLDNSDIELKDSEYGEDYKAIEKPKNINEVVIKLLYREKKEEAYIKWINSVKEGIQVQVNHEVWEEILNSF